MLTESFGRSLGGISVSRGAGEAHRALGAEAHTIGASISLGDHIREDPTDAHSMEVIAHEVAHALAGGGTGEHDVMNFARNMVSTAANTVGQDASALLDLTRTGASSAVNTVTHGASDIWSSTVSGASSAASAVTQGASDTWNKAKDTVSGAWNWLTGG